MKSEDQLPYTERRRPLRPLLKALSLIALGGVALYHVSISGDTTSSPTRITTSGLCPVTQKLVPPVDAHYSDLSYFRSPEYKNYSLNVWGDAVRTYTPTFDDMGPVGEDPRWDVFYEYEKFLLRSFPHVHNASEFVHVKTHGLVFIVHGTDESLKPIILMGHQDVVPVPEDTAARWTYPPTSGYFDGRWLWGRGSGDNKDDHIGLMEAADLLLKQGFKPKRTFIICLGFDEEAHGYNGAREISKYLLERYGPDSIHFLLDEGFGLQDQYGARFATPSMGEKGYLDVNIDLVTSGGHSSIPPRHTAIGIMSELVTLIEAHPYELDLTPESPFWEQLHCYTERGKTVPQSLVDNVAQMGVNKLAKKKVMDTLDDDIMLRYLVSTSQAVDIIQGGLKINALPEKVTMKLNHRVGYETSLEKVKQTILQNVVTVAKKYNLEVEGFDSASSLDASWPVDVPAGKFVLSTVDELNVAPKTPTVGLAWDVFAGTIRHVFEDFAIYPDSDPDVDPEVIVAPSLQSANTDTKYFWDLTRNIFHFGPGQSASRLNPHAVDERVELDAHVEVAAFYYALLRNVYEADQKI